MKAPIPANEAQRLQALRRYEILDTLPERDFDDLTLLASHICRTPIALISLIDSERQWFKSSVGLNVSETSRDVSFCAHAIAEDRPLIIPDATLDSRFAGNKAVTEEPHIRFYAGTVLKTPDGYNIGTLCVIDRQPHQLAPAELEALEALGRQVISQLELRRTVAEKEEAERTLRQSEEKYRSIFEDASDLIMILTPEGRFLYTNPAWKQTLGYSDAELASKSLSDILHPACIEKFSQACSERKTKSIRKFEAVFVTKSGHPIDIEGNLTCHLENAEAGWVQGIFHDVTERKMVDRLKSEFVSTVSHELRTPLTAILGSLGLIAGGVAGPVSERTSAMVEVAHKNSERLVRLINDILDIDKIESGKMHFDLRPTRLLPLLNESIEANRSYAERLGVSFSCISPDTPEEQQLLDNLQVRVDPDRLSQVMANLLSNAAKFSPPGEAIEIKVELLPASLSHAVGSEATTSNGAASEGPTQQTQVRVSVHDKGAGVPPQFHDRIFQKFAQADSSDTRQKGGTGLGLSISKAIIETFGGEIGFTSAPQQQGTTFFFSLPAWQPE